MKKFLFGIFVFLIIGLSLLNSMLYAGWSHSASADENNTGFIPIILGDGQLLPPATLTATPSATVTVTPQPTLTSSPTETLSPTLTPSPTNTPFPAPIIEKFEASPAVILAGQTAQLQWAISGDFDSITILPDVGVVDKNQTEVIVSPFETTAYEIVVAYNVDESVKRTTTVTIGDVGEEITVFNLNRPVTISDHGFPLIQGTDIPIEANGDWTLPPNFADGSLYLRWQIRNQPTVQNMILHFCIWQSVGDSYFERETCTDFQNVAGTSGTIVEADQTIFSMWRNYPLAWDEPRYRYAMVVRDSNACPITDWPVKGASLSPDCKLDEYGDILDWAGYDPALWYPLDLCLTVVAVGKDKAFSGWDNYTYLCN